MTRTTTSTCSAARVAAIGFVCIVLAVGVTPAQEEKDLAARPAPGVIELSAPVTPFVFDGDVRDLPAPQKWKPGDPVKEIPRRFYPSPGTEGQYTPSGIAIVDPLYEDQIVFAPAAGATFTSPTRNFPGQGYSGVNPPDTVGDVGPNHYIQMINAGGGATVAIYDKTEPTPNLVHSFRTEDLGSGQCASGYGDPIVLYDRLAQRWMLSEFSTSGNNLCVYISQTEDPVSGGWYNYAFTAPSFPDYPKYGIWPTDANGGMGSYVVTANDGGPGTYALDRGAMLSGLPGTYQRVTIPGLPGFGFEAAIAPDLDGPIAPPAGAPAIILRHRDTENHSGPAAPGDLLEMWLWDVDWVTPASSLLQTAPSIDVSEFDSDLCGLSSFFCFPQPSGPTLDPLREVIMNRLQYLNFGTHETLVGNLVTDVDGTDHGGIRWFELRQVGGGGWVLHQEGTYSIDSDHRWMAASAMDQSGNIAMAYSVSSTTTFPSLRYTGRLADDPVGLMTQPETSLHAGTAANSSNRWGDYAAMNLDPVDDCTFWFTSLDNTSSNWRTQIASFRFDACGCEIEPPAPVISGDAAADNRIDVSWADSSDETTQVYRVRRALAPGGPYETIAEVADSSPGIGGGPGYVFSDTDVSGGTTYHYVVLASDGAACTSPTSNEVGVTATGACTLDPVFAGVESVTTSFDTTCTLEVSWSTGSASCSGPVVYNVYRSTTPDFMPDFDNRVVAGVNGVTYSDRATLESGQRYYYIVRAVDLSNGVEDGNIIEASGVPLGGLTNGTWVDDGGDTGLSLMVAEGPWSLDETEGNVGPRVYKTGDYGNLTCAALTTPTLQLGPTSALSFASKHNIETSWDKGEVQISTDGGMSWDRLEVGYPGNSTNASDNCGLPTGAYFTGNDLTWATFGSDLSAWAGQLVKIRFLISSDSTQTRDGWWVDEITVSDVDVPGECITGSACEDNPFVGIEPSGPLAVCEGTPVELTTSLTGGTGPFTYQWMRDGLDIPGATDPTYMANDLGAHFYNVRVKAASCDEGATDGSSTAVEWRATPAFAGIVNLESGLDTGCAAQLDWDPADTVCDGPVTYSIYRSTTTPVAITPENRIRSGLTTTSFTDRSGLVDGIFYFYVVRAVENSTGMEDDNTVEAGVEASSEGEGTFVPFYDDFEDPDTFADWTITNAPTHTCGDWALASGSTQRPTAGQGSYAMASSASCASADTTWTTFESPAVNLNAIGLTSVTLGYDLFFNYASGEKASVEVYNGSQWVPVWNAPQSDVNSHQEWDVTPWAQGNTQFKVRFNYAKAIDANWFSVDEVFLLAEVDLTCTTSDVPAGVPDGSGVSSPLRGERMTVSGDMIRTTWDAQSCPASEYNLLYGDLANVGSYTLAGSQCAIGTAGSFDWDGVPAGNLYFLIVGTDGVAMESAWGYDSAGNERNAGAASQECGASAKDGGNVCP